MQQMLLTHVETMLYNINTNKWDNEILKLFNISKNILPEVKILRIILESQKNL